MKSRAGEDKPQSPTDGKVDDVNTVETEAQMRQHPGNRLQAD